MGEARQWGGHGCFAAGFGLPGGALERGALPWQSSCAACRRPPHALRPRLVSLSFSSIALPYLASVPPLAVALLLGRRHDGGQLCVVVGGLGVVAVRRGRVQP